MRVSLFTTCLGDGFFAGSLLAAVRLLRLFGCSVDLPDGQVCCGQPQFNNGLYGPARKLAANLIDSFESSEVLVCPSASCTAMIREYYEQLFAADAVYLEKAKSFAAKTYEFTEFITKVLAVDIGSFAPKSSRTVTYHYSCHSRSIDLAPQVTLDIIDAIEGIKYIPLEKFDQCCGFGGTFAVKMPQVSKALVADKAACILATGADTVLVNDNGCMLNISGHCKRLAIPVRFMHISELLAESLGLVDDIDKSRL